MTNVFITGISRGLGLKLTEHYLCKGCRVIGVSRTMSVELETLIKKYPETLEWHQFDCHGGYWIEGVFSGESGDSFIDERGSAAGGDKQDRADDENREVVAGLDEQRSVGLNAPYKVESLFDIAYHFDNGEEEDENADSGNDAYFSIFECVA